MNQMRHIKTWLRLFKHFILHRIVWLGAGIGYGVYLTHDNLQMVQQRAKYHTEFINRHKDKVTDNVYIIKPTDRYRIHDCWLESNAPIRSHNFMDFFDGKHDPLNALINFYGEPLYIYLAGLERWNEDSVVMMGLRGINIGSPSSQVTYYLNKLYQETDNTLLFMPSSFINMTGEDFYTDHLRSLCHKKYYRGKYYGASWPTMRNDRSWEFMTSLLGDKGHIYIFSYSNGTIARDDLIRTKGINPPSLWSVSVMDAAEFSEEYDANNKFTWPDKLDRIDGMIDAETNYEGGRAPWNLSKYLKEHVANNPKKMYYAACALDSGVAINHVFIINTLDMVGVETDEGIVRYQNAMRNVTIDILTNNKGNPYVWGNVNLRTQTVFLPHSDVRYRLHLGHYNILPFSVGNYKKLATERGVLNFKMNPLQFANNVE